jgi:hypothetical protein
MFVLLYDAFLDPTLSRRLKNGIPTNSNISKVKKKKSLLPPFKRTKEINNYFSQTFP